MRALALLLCLLSAQAWGAAETYVRAPWRAVTWLHAPDLMWVVGVTVALIAVWIVCLLRGDRNERRLGSLLAVFLMVGISFNAKLAGTIFYARPAAECANNGDGSAYGCAASGGAAGAWRTMANVVWGVSGVNTGDALRVCSSESSPFTTADYDGGGLAVLSVDQSGVTVDGDCSASGGVTMAYMTGNGTRDYGVYCADTTTCPNQTWRNITVSSTDFRGFYVRNSLDTASVVNFTGNNLHAIDIIQAGVGNVHGIAGFGDTATITDPSSTRVTDDGFSWQGPNFTLDRWTVVYPGYNESTNVGDCVQVVNAGDNAIIRNGYCDKTNNATKQCIIIGDPATGDNALIEGNTCLMAPTGGATNSTKSIYSVVPNTRFVRNYVRGGYYGIYMLGAGSSAVGNILVGQELRGIDTVSTVSSGTHIVANNTVSGAVTGIVLNGGASVTNNVYNNVVANATTAYNKGGSSTLNQDFNAAFNSTTNSNGAGTIDITADPQFLGGTSPTSAAGFCLPPDSPLLAAGTYLGAWAVDYYGVAPDNPPNIGAMGSSCGGRASAGARATR